MSKSPAEVAQAADSIKSRYAIILVERIITFRIFYFIPITPLMPPSCVPFNTEHGRY